MSFLLITQEIAEVFYKACQTVRISLGSYYTDIGKSHVKIVAI